MTNLQVSHLYKSEVVHVKLSQLVSVNYTCISLPLTLKIIVAVDSGRAYWPQEDGAGQRQWQWL